MKKKNVQIVYYCSNKDFSFSRVFSMELFKKRVKDYRYFSNAKEYKPVLIKESFVNWFFLSLLIWGVYLMLETGQSWSEKLIISFLVGAFVIPVNYFVKVRNLHQEPKRIYEQIESMFGTLLIDDKVVEVEPLCFFFKKKKYDFRLEYKKNNPKGSKSFCKLTVYFRYKEIESKELLRSRFNYQMYNEWSIDKNYPYMAVCWLSGTISADDFEQLIERVLTTFQEMQFMPSIHLEGDELMIKPMDV